MNARLLFGNTLLGAVLGAAILATAFSFTPLRSSPTPELKPQRWEYKVMYIFSGFGAAGDQSEKVTEQFNVLAKDGWEYNGTVGPESTGRGGGGRQYVVFRRFKP